MPTHFCTRASRINDNNEWRLQSAQPLLRLSNGQDGVGLPKCGWPSMTQVHAKQANLIVRSRADAPHLKKAALAIEQAAWSHLGYLSYSRAHYDYYAELLDAYPEYQLCLVDNE